MYLRSMFQPAPGAVNGCHRAVASHHDQPGHHVVQRAMAHGQQRHHQQSPESPGSRKIRPRRPAPAAGRRRPRSSLRRTVRPIIACPGVADTGWPGTGNDRANGTAGSRPAAPKPRPNVSRPNSNSDAPQHRPAIGDQDEIDQPGEQRRVSTPRDQEIVDAGRGWRVQLMVAHWLAPASVSCAPPRGGPGRW